MRFKRVQDQICTIEAFLKFKNVAIVHGNCFEFTTMNTDDIKYCTEKCLPVVVVVFGGGGIEVEI